MAFLKSLLEISLVLVLPLIFLVFVLFFLFVAGSLTIAVFGLELYVNQAGLELIETWQGRDQRNVPPCPTYLCNSS